MESLNSLLESVSSAEEGLWMVRSVIESGIVVNNIFGH